MPLDSSSDGLSDLVKRTVESVDKSQRRVLESARLYVASQALLDEHHAIARPLPNKLDPPVDPPPLKDA